MFILLRNRISNVDYNFEHDTLATSLPIILKSSIVYVNWLYTYPLHLRPYRKYKLLH